MTVKNEGNVTVTEGKLDDDHADLSGETFELAPGETAEFTYTYTVTQADVDAGRIVNVVKANATAARGDDPEEAEGTATVTAEQNPKMTVNKVTTSTPKDPKGYAEGEKITYKITVKNEGNVTISDITVTDKLTGDEWKIDSLAPAGEKSFETTYKVTKADAESGEVLNVATVKGNPPDDPDNPDDPDDPIEDEDEEPNPTVVKLVIRYWVDGVLDSTITRYEKPGTKYDVVSPPKAGYSVDIERVKGTLTKDTEYDVHYTRTEYTLTILYQYADGTTAAETYTATLNTGDAYSVVSPVIEGYRTDLTIVEGTMPARNVTVTVIYVQRPAGPGLVTIDDFMTPLGLGLGGLNVGDCVE